MDSNIKNIYRFHYNVDNNKCFVSTFCAEKISDSKYFYRVYSPSNRDNSVLIEEEEIDKVHHTIDSYRGINGDCELYVWTFTNDVNKALEKIQGFIDELINVAENKLKDLEVSIKEAREENANLSILRKKIVKKYPTGRKEPDNEEDLDR